MKTLLLLLTLLLASPVRASWNANGADQRVVLSSNAVLAFADADWTVSLWFYIENNTGTSQNSLLSTSASPADNPYFGFECYEASHATLAGQLRVEVNEDIAAGSTDRFLTSSSSPCNTTGTWQHVIARRTTNGFSLSINGSSEAVGGADANWDYLAAQDWYFFTRSSLANDIAGRVCDVAKWTRSLTDAEASALASGISAGLNQFQEGRVFWAPTWDYSERMVPLTVTNTSTVIGSCPRMIWPQ